MSVMVEVDTDDGIKLLSVESIGQIEPGKVDSEIDDNPVAMISLKRDSPPFALKQSYVSFLRLLSGNGIKIIRG